ncbi:MAG: AAA family ATPase [Pseudomonadota bacterium]|nr:AAA family ATPase [Pseudomonadota bacterium]
MLPSEVRPHKFFTPPVYPGAVPRQVILDRVLRDDSLRVTLLQGPAGHGKSTTLQQIKSAHEARGWRTA